MVNGGDVNAMWCSVSEDRGSQSEVSSSNSYQRRTLPTSTWTKSEAR